MTTITEFSELQKHVGHKIACLEYKNTVEGKSIPFLISVECADCEVAIHDIALKGKKKCKTCNAELYETNNTGFCLMHMDNKPLSSKEQKAKDVQAFL